MEAGYVLAFTTGLLGGFGHCIGMCGPLVASYTLYAGQAAKAHPVYIPHLLYNAGRITSYAAIGSFMGLSGAFLNIAGRLAGLQNIVAIVAGILMVLMGLGMSGVMKGIRSFERHNSIILKAGKVVLESGSPLRYYPLGLLLGFLPCGLSASVFLGAAGTGGLLQGMFFAFCFGMGTLPALFSFGMVMTHISHTIRGWIYRVGGIFVMGTGIYFLMRGIFGNA